MTRLALTVGLALMDMCWLYVWAVLLGRLGDPRQFRPLLSPVSILGLILLAAFSTQYLGRRALASNTMRWALLAGGAIAILVVLRIDQYPGTGGLDWLGQLASAVAVAIGSLTSPVLAFALGWFAWRRGINLGRQTSSSIEVESAFRWGIGMLVLFGVVQLITSRPALESVQSETTLYVVGFFFVSLLTLALGRLESLTTRTRSIGINSQWLSVLVVISAGVVLVALLLGQLLSFDLLIVATRPIFDVLGQVIVLLLYIIVIPIAWVLEWIFYFIFSLLQPAANQPRPRPPEPSDVDNMLQRLFSQGMPPEVLGALKAGGALLVMAVAVYLLHRAFQRWRPTGAEAEAAEEERETVFAARRLREVLLAWLRRLFRRGDRGAAPSVVGDSEAAGEADTSAAGSVRELYRELLRRGETAGIARPPSTTPLEHRVALDAALAPPRVVDEVTAAYVEVRYAERGVADEEVERLGTELAQVHTRAAAQEETVPSP
jgi:hypothetical protein